jgi:hypothetical protein
MLDMLRATAILALFVSCSFLSAQNTKQPALPSFNYDIARTHEIQPHRHTIPMKGVHVGFNQLSLTLTISPTGDVLHAEPAADKDSMKFWPQLEGEVFQWKFTPFQQNGIPVAATVQEYINLVPPEHLPTTHIPAPALHPNSKVTITLERSGCFGTCSSYSVNLSSNGTIHFDGSSFVVAIGKHTATIDPEAVRNLAKDFIAADFYSMDSTYEAAVTDNPTYILTIDIDGHSKQVLDYVGQWVGMPTVIVDLENKVDTVGNTKRWTAGAEGLVPALQAEHYDFQTFAAQVILKQAASNGQTATVVQLLQVGVPLNPLAASKQDKLLPLDRTSWIGWLQSACRHPETLSVFIQAGASRNDQSDKDLALLGAANAGNLPAVQALIAYGANPNADLSKLVVTQSDGGMTMQGPGSGSVLIAAAASGNPDMVREILRYHPNLEARDREGDTAMFAAGVDRYGDKDGARVECIDLLAKAGANVNARNKEGTTPLQETYLPDVKAELLKLGANDAE